MGCRNCITILVMNRRGFKNYFPEPRFQAKFLLFLVGGAVVQTALTYLVVGYFVSQNYELLVKYAGLEKDILNILSGELKKLIWVMSAASAAFVSGTFLLGVVFSHRVAGPIYALKRTIRELNGGKDSFLKLRAGDEFTEMADDFNALVRKLKDKKAAA